MTLSPGDDFDTKMTNLRKFFTRCRDRGLSLSPSKTKLFFTDVLLLVNAECIKHGLPPFWEEVREPGETDEAMLEAVENAEGRKSKLSGEFVMHSQH